MGSTIGRWDWLEGVRRESADDVIAREAGARIAGELLRWPPQLAWTDATEQARYAALFAPGAPAPAHAALLLGIQLARWELERDVDRVSSALRNGVPDELGAAGALAARFVWRWLPEWLYELNERAASRLPRSLLLRAVDEAAARVRAAGA